MKLAKHSLGLIGVLLMVASVSGAQVRPAGGGAPGIHPQSAQADGESNSPVAPVRREVASLAVAPSFHLDLMLGEHFNQAMGRQEFDIVRANVTWSHPPGLDYPDSWMVRQSVEHTQRSPDTAARPSVQTPTPVAAVGDPDAPTVMALGFAPHANPARLPLTIECSVPRRGPARFEVVDVMGRAVTRRELPEGLGERRFAITDIRLSPGVYWMRLRQGSREVTTKLVVIR